jgi:hypothetical protein
MPQTPDIDPAGNALDANLAAAAFSFGKNEAIRLARPATASLIEGVVSADAPLPVEDSTATTLRGDYPHAYLAGLTSGLRNELGDLT